MSADPRTVILKRPMSAAQWFAVGLCGAMMAVDGYDTLAITLALPGLSAAWGVGKVALGGLVSIGLIGMAAGCLLLGPLGDIFGRRPMAFVSLILTTIGMTGSALATDIDHLLFWRLCTGVGMGSMITVAYPLASEYSNSRNRPIALALIVISFPLGGAIGSLAATALMPHFGWRAAFVPGIVLPGIVGLLCLRWLPEPLGLFIERPRSGSLKLANAYLRRLDLPMLQQLPSPSQRKIIPIRRVLGAEFLSITLYLSGIYCLYSCVAYFLVAWLPTIVADRGFSPITAASVSVAVSIGGIIGAAVTGLSVRKMGLFPVLLSTLLGLAATTVLIGVAPPHIGLLRALGFIAGMFIWGPIVGVNLLIAEEYPVEVRATGTGFVVGSSRWFAAAGPLLGGFLLSAGLGIATSCAAVALACVAAAGLYVRFHIVRRSAHSAVSYRPAETA